MRSLSIGIYPIRSDGTNTNSDKQLKNDEANVRDGAY